MLSTCPQLAAKALVRRCTAYTGCLSRSRLDAVVIRNPACRSQAVESRPPRRYDNLLDYAIPGSSELQTSYQGGSGGIPTKSEGTSSTGSSAEIQGLKTATDSHKARRSPSSRIFEEAKEAAGLEAKRKARQPQSGHQVTRFQEWFPKRGRNPQWGYVRSFCRLLNTPLEGE